MLIELSMKIIHNLKAKFALLLAYNIGRLEHR